MGFYENEVAQKTPCAAEGVNIVKKFLFVILTLSLLVSWAAMPAAASDIIFEQDFESEALPPAVTDVQTEGDGNHYWKVAAGNWTGSSGTLTFPEISSGKIRVKFDYKQATASATARAQYVVLEGNEGAADNKNRLAVLSDRGPALGAFTNDERTRVLVDNPDVSTWYTVEADIDLTGHYDNETEKHSITARIKKRGENEYKKTVEADLNRTSTDFLGWAESGSSFHTLRVIGNAGGNIDNITIEKIYDPPKVDASRITITDCNGESIKNFSDVNPAIDSIEIDFGTEMDIATLTQSNVYLKKKDGSVVSGEPVYNNGKVTLVIDNCLEPETDYILFIGRDAANMAGVTVGDEDAIFDIKTNKGSVRAVFGNVNETDELSIPVTYTNSTAASVIPGFAVAYYGLNEQLMGLELSNGAEINAMTKTQTETFTHTKKEISGVQSWKIMLWDSLESRRPIADSISSAETVDSNRYAGKTEIQMAVGEGSISGTIRVYGTGAAPNDLISIAVFPGKNASGNLTAGVPAVGNDVFDTEGKPVSGAVAFAGDCIADSDGAFSKEFEIAKTGWYSVFVTSAYSGEEKCEPEFAFIDKEKYAVVINGLNFEAAKLNDGDPSNDNDAKAVFRQLAAENLFILGIESALTSQANFDDAAAIFCETVMNESLDAEQKEENIAKWNMCVYSSMLNASSLTDTTNALADMISKDRLNRYYIRRITEKEHKEYLTQKMSGQGIKSLSDLTKCYREALVLTVVRYPDGPGNIQEIFKDSTEVTGISLNDVTSRLDVYRNLSGSYSSIESMRARYEELCKIPLPGTVQPGGGTSGGTSGGSSGGSSKSSGRTTPVLNISGTTASDKEQVNMPFDDLDTVMWAYEAIATLADRGIINGKSETKFGPRENITREEFVKIIMQTFGYEITRKNNVFSDINENDWFADYVNCAYERSLISGVGENRFGTGEPITRQDMAVIIYNALLANGTDITCTDTAFTDSDAISDYAINAVGALSSDGIINGYEDGSFAPKGTATRAEAVQMIFGVLKTLE